MCSCFFFQVERAIKHLSKELTWKLFFEAAQAEERAQNFAVARQAYVESVRNCPENLLWKVRCLALHYHYSFFFSFCFLFSGYILSSSVVIF